MSRQASSELIYFVSGLWCQTCASTVETMAGHCRGVASAKLNFVSKILQIRVDPSASPEKVHEDIMEKSEPSGFALRRLGAGWIHTFKKELEREMERRVRPILTAIVFFLAMWSSMLAFAAYLGGLSRGQEFLLTCLATAFGLPAVLLGMQPFARAGLRAVLTGRTLTLDLFIALGALSATILSVANLSQGLSVTYVDSAAMILTVLLIAKNIDARLAYSLSTRVLNTVKPLEEAVDVLRKDHWKKRPVSQVRRGERVRLAAGQTVPLDGRVVGGPGLVDRHLVSGESTLSEVKESDEILAGLVACSSLQFVVSQPLGCRMIDSWAESALVAPDRGHVHSRFLRRWEQRLVQVALFGASLVFLFRIADTGSVWAGMVGFFVGILIFCPCLFASILPAAKQMASLCLLQKGVLLHRAEALFDLSTVKRVYLDKTGTLEGVETIFEPTTEDPRKIQLARDLLTHLKALSAHPILKGLGYGVPEETISPVELREVAGQGVFASFPGMGTITVGRPEFVRGEIGQNKPSSSEGSFPVVALNRTLVGVLVTKAQFDQIGQEFLNDLIDNMGKDVAIEVLSGDPNPSAATRYTRHPSQSIGYAGNLSPQDKADRIVNPSLFVGDGLNDTLALSRAQVSCRVGERARDFAPVDLHIQGANLGTLIDVIKYSRRFLHILEQTVLLAFLYNVIALTLAAFGLFTPLGAVLAMLVSFLALLTSVARLLRWY